LAIKTAAHSQGACSVTAEDTMSRQRVVRAVMVDDHPAMRAGIRSVLETAPAIAFVGEASEARELWPVLERTAPDVVLIDFHLPDEDGLVLCHRLKRSVPAPRVVMISAYADDAMTAPALLAQADALLSKRASARVLCETLREVVLNSADSQELSPEQRRRLGEVLEPEEVALAGLLLLRSPPREIARAVGLEPNELDARIDALLRRVGAAYGLPQQSTGAGHAA
jgi:DNA-binding NarL/FixJ family response regulator